MFRPVRVSIYVGLIAAILSVLSLAALANEPTLSLDDHGLADLTQRLERLAAKMDEETAERLGQILYELNQLLDPEDLMTILQLLAVRTELSHTVTSYAMAEPMTVVHELDTKRMAAPSEIHTLPSAVEGQHPSYLLTDRVSATELAPRQALIARAVVSGQTPVVHHVSAQPDIPSLIQQLNIALQNPALEWRLPDGTPLRPRIVIELVPVVEARSGQGRVLWMPESAEIRSVVIQDIQIDE